MRINNRPIGRDHPPYIIAEMSANHGKDFGRAEAIVHAAKEAGADAVKLQTYTADTLTLNCASPLFRIGEGSPWAGRTLYDLYEEAAMPWDWTPRLKEIGEKIGLTVFSTPFDHSAVEFLESVDMPAYKIASFENVDIPLIRRVAGTGKPLIISTGMATVAELDDAAQAVREEGCEEFVFLKCTSSYPNTPEGTNLRTIPHMAKLFGCETGLSDHTLGLGVAVASVALGATVIEKHFTLARADGGVDATFSIEPEELRALVDECRCAWEGLGQVSYGPTEKEHASLMLRRSLFVTQDLKAGDRLTESNVRSIRPGHGLPPKCLDAILGMRVVKDVVRGHPVCDALFR